MGSPLYMSPEALQAKEEVDARSDIWALGVILYELVAGRTPFESDTLLTPQTKVFLKPPEPLTTYLPNAPPALETIILQCLDKRPERRWPSVADLAAALVRFAPPAPPCTLRGLQGCVESRVDLRARPTSCHSKSRSFGPRNRRACRQGLSRL